MVNYKLFCDGIRENDFKKVTNNFSKSFLDKEHDYYKSYPLCIVSNNGYINMVKFFLSKKCNIECEDSFNHMRPLHYAAINGKLEVVKLLIQHGADKEASTHRKVRPVHFAVCSNHVHIFRYLLSIGVKTDIITEEEELGNRSIFDIMKQCNYFECEDLYKKWIDYDTKIFDMVRKNEFENFKEAFFKEKIAVLQKNLNLNVVDIAVEKQARNFLTYIFQQDPEEKNVVQAFQRILKQRNVSSQQFIKQYRLYHSILFNIHEEFNENLTIKTVNSNWIATQESFLQICVTNKRLAFIDVLLPYIIEITESLTKAIGQLEIMELDLTAQKVSNRLETLKSCKTNYQRLILAVQDRHLPMITYLLDKNGTEKTKSDELLSNPLILAINLNYDDISDYFIRRKLFLDQKDMDGRLPIVYALLNKNFKVVENIIEFMNIKSSADLLQAIPLAILYQQIRVIQRFFFESNFVTNIMTANPIIPLDRLLDRPLLPISFDSECLCSLYLKLHRYIPEPVRNLIEEHLNHLEGDFNDTYYNLHLAVRLLNEDMIKIFLDTYYPVDTRDKMNNENNLLLSLITQAIESETQGYFDVMKLLVEYGVSITETNDLNQSALNQSYESQKSLRILLSSPQIQNQEIPIEPERLLKFYNNKWYDVLEKLLPMQPLDTIKEVIRVCLNTETSSLEMIDFIKQHKSNTIDWSEIAGEFLVLSAECDNSEVFDHFLESFKLNETFYEDKGNNNILSELIEKGANENYCLEFCQNQNSEVLTGFLKLASSESQESCLHVAVKKKYLEVFQLLLLEIQDCSILEQTSVLSENKSPLELLLLLYQDSIESALLEKIIKIMIKIGYDIHHKVNFNKEKIPLIDLIKNDRLKNRLIQFHKRESDKRTSEVLKIEEAVKNDLEILSRQCSICSDNEISFSIDGCGHTFCSDCIHKLDKCPYCRTSIKKRQRIFLTQS